MKGREEEEEGRPETYAVLVHPRKRQVCGKAEVTFKGKRECEDVEEGRQDAVQKQKKYPFHGVAGSSRRCPTAHLSRRERGEGE